MKNNWVSASDVGRATFCPHYLELKFKGATPSNESIALRAKGEESHERLNKQATDKRCFVATHLYGADDPRTVMLRDFRDTRLKKSVVGRVLISFYYQVSPTLVTLAKSSSLLERTLGLIVGVVVRLTRNGAHHD